MQIHYKNALLFLYIPIRYFLLSWVFCFTGWKTIFGASQRRVVFGFVFNMYQLYKGLKCLRKAYSAKISLLLVAAASHADLYWRSLFSLPVACGSLLAWATDCLQCLCSLQPVLVQCSACWYSWLRVPGCQDTQVIDHRELIMLC